MNTVNKFVLAFVVFGLSAVSHANLLVNGGFEEPAIDSGWTYGDTTGWVSPEGDFVEVWRTPFLGVDAYEGNQIGELNSHPNTAPFTIQQTFDTVAGMNYEFSFAYRARVNDQESFEVDLTGVLDDVLFDDHVTDAWSTYSNTFAGTGSAMTLAFTSVTPDSTLGNLLDGVSVTAVSEPPAIILFGLGLVGLVATRRKLAK